MSDATRRLIDEEQQFITDQAHRRAMALVNEHRPLLEAFASTLLDKEVLERADIERLVVLHEGRLPHPARLEPLLGRGSERRVAASEALDQRPAEPGS